MTRDQAWQIVQDFTPSESLRKHMLAVEAAMVWYANHYDQDPELWAITGLLHDFDYESHPNLGPDGHPFWGVNYLRENTDLPEEVLYAILGHYRESGTPRETLMAKALFAVDELCGLITAACLVRPDKSIELLETSSVLKKLKDKAFAKGVNREDINIGITELEIDLAQHVTNTILAMRERATALGLSLKPVLP
jgi:predicted hydrolase (HD superfamily)